MALTREECKAKRNKVPKELVEVPELGGSVYVTKLTAGVRDLFDKKLNENKVNGEVNLENVRAKFVALVVVDEDGKRLFEDSDIEWLGELDSDGIQKIVDVGFRINGIGTGVIENAINN